MLSDLVDSTCSRSVARSDVIRAVGSIPWTAFVMLLTQCPQVMPWTSNVTTLLFRW